MSLDSLRIPATDRLKISALRDDTDNLRVTCEKKLKQMGYKPGMVLAEAIEPPADITQAYTRLIRETAALPENEFNFIHLNGLRAYLDKDAIEKAKSGKTTTCLTMLPQVLGQMNESLHLLGQEDDVHLACRHFFLAAYAFNDKAVNVYVRSDEEALEEARGMGLRHTPLTLEDFDTLTSARKRLCSMFTLLPADQKSEMSKRLAPDEETPHKTIDALVDDIEKNDLHSVVTASRFIIRASKSRWPKIYSGTSITFKK